MAQMDPWKKMRFSSDQLESYLGQGGAGAHKYKIEIDQSLAGVAVIRYPWLIGPYLELLAIVPGFQDRGLGQAVLSWFETQARSSGQSNLWVLTSSFNCSALRFYEKFGFEFVAELESLVMDGFNEIMLRKRI